MREISLGDTPTRHGWRTECAVLVYDTSGPYSDSEANIDLRGRAWAMCARAWIDRARDTENSLGSAPSLVARVLAMRRLDHMPLCPCA